MMRIVLFLLLFSFLYVPQVAARVPSCGDLDKDEIEDVFEHADDVRFYYDVGPDLNETCAVLERFEEWEKAQPREVISDRAYKKERKAVLAEIRRAFAGMNSPLTVMRLWLRVNPKDERQWAVRKARIRGARRDLKDYREALAQGREALGRLMR